MATGKHANDKDQEDFVENNKEIQIEILSNQEDAKSEADGQVADSDPALRKGKRPRIRKPLFSVTFPKE